MCKHEIYNHHLYIYLICLGVKKKKKKENDLTKIQRNLTKILYKTATFNLQKVNIRPLCDKKEIYGGI